MGSISFAFSVHHFINSVGADAGFASIIGLAILVLLYFAQAREAASLREQLYEWAQHVQQLENRITQLTRQPAAPQPGAPAHLEARTSAASAAPARQGAVAVGAPVPAAAPVGAAAAAHSVPLHVGAPAGVGAPALTAATKLIPTAVPAAVAAEAAAATVAAPEPDLTTVGTPAPATVAGGANGTASHVPAPQPVSAGGAGRAAVADPVSAPPPRIQIRPNGPTGSPGRRPPLSARATPPPAPSRGRRIVAVLIGLLVLAGAVVAVLLLTQSSSKSPSSTAAPNGTATTTTQHHRNRTAASAPSSVTVAVLNGTATAQLAHRVALKLGALGYKQGNVATAADQTRTSTVVAYLPGHRRDALAVASSLKLGPASVQAIDPSTQAVACPPSTACTAGVVVTVGSDLASTQ